jgi:hypothetical protein
MSEKLQYRQIGEICEISSDISVRRNREGTIRIKLKRGGLT